MRVETVSFDRFAVTREAAKRWFAIRVNNL